MRPRRISARRSASRRSSASASWPAGRGVRSAKSPNGAVTTRRPSNGCGDPARRKRSNHDSGRSATRRRRESSCRNEHGVQLERSGDPCIVHRDVPAVSHERVDRGHGEAGAPEVRLDRLDDDHPRPIALQRSPHPRQDRKSTRLNSSHVAISYAVFCLKKKKRKEEERGKKGRKEGRRKEVKW